MQNEFLPEETPQYRAPAPLVSQTETANETVAAAENTLSAIEVQTEFRAMKRAAQRRVVGFTVALIMLGVLPMMLALTLGNPTSAGIIGVIIGAYAAYMTRLAALFLARGRAKPLRDYARLARLGGAAAVGPLLELRQANLIPANGAAIDAALTLCLPQMKPEDAPLLTANQRYCLHTVLRRNVELEENSAQRTDFCLAMLKALEQIGDASEVPLVERLAALNARNPDNKRIRDAARECLPLLKIRAGMMAESQTLLRASSLEQTGRDTLLRPAQGASDKAPEQLLRPSDSGE